MLDVIIFGDFFRQKAAAKSISRSDGFFIISGIIADDFKQLLRIVFFHQICIFYIIPQANPYFCKFLPRKAFSGVGFACGSDV